MKTEKSTLAAPRAALYCRVSTEEQAVHGLSIEAQREALDAWAAENRVQVMGHYEGHFIWCCQFVRKSNNWHFLIASNQQKRRK